MILVTGSAGFIGFHLTQKLFSLGFKVVGIDNFNPYYDTKLKHDRADILRSMGIEIFSIDISDDDAIKDLFQKYDFSHVAHLAAQAGVRYSITHPKSYLGPNINGFVTLLEACKEKKTPFIYASSSSVYGCNTKIPFSETDRVDSPSNLYGATKKANELIASAYHHLFQIPVTGLRFFTVYGPFGRPDMAYFSFTKALFEGTEISVFNEGNMQRDFTFIDDIVDGIVASLQHSYPHEVFNLGNNQPENLTDFIHHIEKAAGKKAHLKYLPLQKGDMLKTYADIDHAKARLGFNPKTSLSEGIEKFVKWYRTYYGIS